MDEPREGLNPVAIGAVVVVAAVAVVGGYYWLHHRAATPAAPVAEAPPAPVAPPVPTPVTPAPAPPAPPQAIVMAPPTGQPRLTLDHSDRPFLDALQGIAGWRASILHLLIPHDLIRHLVATVDALGRDKVALRVMPTKPVPGQFQVTATASQTWIAAANAERYRPYVAALTSFNAAQSAHVYQRFAYLFQEAYRNLGYPDRRFQDRLVQVLGEMIDAPEPKPPVAVQTSSAMFLYADPDLEALTAGQKILIRMGPENERTVKQWLRAFRAAVVAK